MLMIYTLSSYLQHATKESSLFNEREGRDVGCRNHLYITTEKNKKRRRKWRWEKRAEFVCLFCFVSVGVVLFSRRLSLSVSSVNVENKWERFIHSFIRSFVRSFVHCHVLARFIFAFSIMYFPSLYFWLSSYATSYNQIVNHWIFRRGSKHKKNKSRKKGNSTTFRCFFGFISGMVLFEQEKKWMKVNTNTWSWTQRDKEESGGEEKLRTYFQPITSWQQLQ
jgi:hypothetical protein